ERQYALILALMIIVCRQNRSPQEMRGELFGVLRSHRAQPSVSRQSALFNAIILPSTKWHGNLSIGQRIPASAGAESAAPKHKLDLQRFTGGTNAAQNRLKSM